MAADLTAVLFALGREAGPFLRRLRERRRITGAPCPAWVAGWPGWSLRHPGSATGASKTQPRPPRTVLVLQTGMGEEATARATDWLLQEARPARALSAGFCGSLVSDLSMGTVVQPEEVVSAAGRWSTNAGPRVGKPVRLVTVTAPVMDGAARRELHQQTGAAVVDMESATAARLCGAAKVAFHSIRVVSDDLAQPLPADLLPALKGERVDVWALSRALLRRPGLAVDLCRLARQTCRASLVLAEALEDFLSRPVPSDT